MTTLSRVTSARLFVGNLSLCTSEDALRAAFAAVGPVAEVHLVQDRYTGRTRGFAFVTMADRRKAEAAAEKMNGAVLDGKSLHVRATESRAS